ncbi:glutathione S-transferase family protein [Pseudophaeobacter sp.]|uniref:glutathione S-transferase family protein n=1 Tax=Pseudophaeobacter sp. TaxID=1971739 RepID=UPI0032999683
MTTAAPFIRTARGAYLTTPQNQRVAKNVDVFPVFLKSPASYLVNITDRRFTTMIKIVSFKICPFVQRVTALLEAKGLDYEVEFISLADKPAWFLQIAPNGQVPILITDQGQALFESEAIVEYIQDAYGALQPDLSPEDKARERAWGYLAAKNYLVQCAAQRSNTQEDLTSRAAKLGQLFDKVEKQLSSGATFFSGESIGWVDIAWLVLLHRAGLIQESSGFDFIGDRPKLKRWQGNLLKTGLAEKSVATDFDMAFRDFYLSEQTLLGRKEQTEVQPCSDSSSKSGGCC